MAPAATAGGTRLGDALERYYADHGLAPDGGAHDAWFHVRLGPLTIPLPNPPSRRRAVFLHDVNHVLTVYDTVVSRGEFQIAAFEVAAGCGRVWIAWFINLFMFGLGLVFRPRMTWRAFRHGRRSGSIYRLAADRSVLRDMAIDDVRRLVNVKPVVAR